MGKEGNAAAQSYSIRVQNEGGRRTITVRGADVDYARAFIKAIPGEDKIAGFYIGPADYVWGRDFLTKDFGSAQQTVMQKQSLSFALWGTPRLRSRPARSCLRAAHRRPFRWR